MFFIGVEVGFYLQNSFVDFFILFVYLLVMLCVLWGHREGLSIEVILDDRFDPIVVESFNCPFG